MKDRSVLERDQRRSPSSARGAGNPSGVRRGSACERRAGRLDLLCNTGRGLMESRWASTPVKVQCNELQSFSACVYIPPPLLRVPPPLPPCPTSQTLLGGIHLCHLRYTDLHVFQHCQRCPWQRFLPPPRLIPHTVIYPCLFPFNFLTVSELQGIGLVILQPEGSLAWRSAWSTG